MFLLDLQNLGFQSSCQVRSLIEFFKANLKNEIWNFKKKKSFLPTPKNFFFFTTKSEVFQGKVWRNANFGCQMLK